MFSMRFYQPSVAYPGCLSRIRIIPSRIADPLSFLPQKIVSKLSEIISELLILDPDFLPIPDPRSRGQKGTGSRIQIRNTVSTYFSDILDLLRSSTTRKDEEEAGVMENVEVDVENVMEDVEDGDEVEDSGDEVLVLEDTTGGQDRESAEVIIYVTVIRFNRVADPDSQNFLLLDPDPH
jgi:hypothetical protein